MRVLFILLFICLATTVVTSVHYYFFRRLAVSTALPARWRKITKVTLIVLASLMPVGFLLTRFFPPALARVVVYPAFLWLGLMFMLFWALVLTEPIRLGAWVFARFRRGAPDDGPNPTANPREEAVNSGRRALLARALSGTALFTVIGAAGMGMRHALGRLVVRRVEVTLPSLPRALDGFTIVQLTDMHLGPTRTPSWTQSVVDRVNKLQPDLVAITGDLVDGSVSQLRDQVAPLAKLTPRHGVFFVTGNHEYISGAKPWIRELPRLNIRVLQNERVSVGRGSATFDLAGVNDWDARRMAPGQEMDVCKALGGRATNRASVLLAHQPRAIYEAAKHGAGLVLSGHTHGGQIWPMRHLVPLQQPYVRGLAKHGGTHIYVSSGTGFWGPPIRLGSTAEITRVVLRSPHAAGPTKTRAG